MVNIQKVWNCNFLPHGAYPIPIVSARCNSWPVEGDRTIFGSYASIIRYNPSPGVYYGYTYGPLWNDNNHSQIERLYLPFIMTTVLNPMPGVLATDCIPAPSRTERTENIKGLDLYGGKLELELTTNNLQLDQYLQINLLMQWYDPEANDGRGSNVNYILCSKVSICEKLGYTPANARSVNGEQKTTGWTTITVQFPSDPQTELDMVAIDGRPDKVQANVYGHSKSIREAFKRQLLNLMIVFHNGQNIPDRQPTSRIGGGFGELYIRKAELSADLDLNPNAVIVA